MRTLTKSPLDLAREALAIGEEGFPKYSHRNSPKFYTQAQLFAILVLRQYFRLDYRGTTQLLSEFSELCSALKLSRIPHYSTLCLAEARLLQTTLSSACSSLLSTVRDRAA